MCIRDRVGPHHVDAAAAFGRERELEELVLSRKTGVYVAIPTDGRVHDGFGDAGLGDERGLGAGDETSIGGTQAGDVGGGGKHVQRRDAEKRPLCLLYTSGDIANVCEGQADVSGARSPDTSNRT